MSLINIAKFVSIFKKKFNRFLFLTLIFVSFFILANLTIFKEKLDKVFDVTFDYQYKYTWSDPAKRSFEFNTIVSQLKHKGMNRENLQVFPFESLKVVHALYFSLLYQYNLDDIKTNDFKNKYHKIATAFNFDNNNFVYKNKKIHIAWHNLEEAEEYLESLHNRSVENIKTTLRYNLKQNENFIISEIDHLFKVYPLEDLKKAYLISIKMEDGIDGLDGFETNKLIDNKIIESNYHKMSNTELIEYLLSPPLYFLDQKLALEKHKLLVYYFAKKFNSDTNLNLRDVPILPKYENLIENINKYLPIYHKKIKEVNFRTLYFIEILLSLIISLLVTFLPEQFKRKKN